jgi:hypothetical protein
MNHRPFEDWLLEDLPLSPEQNRELQSHLRVCDSCGAIAESNLALRSARVLSPAPGFTARWQERLVAEHRTQQQRLIAGMLSFSLSGLFLLALLTGPLLRLLIGSPAVWISTLVQALLFSYTMLTAVVEAGVIFFRVVPSFVPPFVWLVLLSAISGLGLLGSVSIWRLTRLPQGVHS